jgi:hypothetical protein
MIMGGESGKHFRPVKIDDLRSVRDQTKVAGVALFFKQHGGRTAKSGGNVLDGRQWLEFPFDVTPFVHQKRTRRAAAPEPDEDIAADDLTADDLAALLAGAEIAPDDIAALLEETEPVDDPDAEEAVSEPEGSPSLTSDRPDNDQAPGLLAGETSIPTIAEMLSAGAITRRNIERADGTVFYGHLAQARRLCIARNPPPHGWGLRGEEYAEFSAALGYQGTRGKLLPRLFQPYGKKVVAWVRARQKEAKKGGQMFEFPTWQSALRQMESLYEGKTPNTKTAAETAPEDDAKVAEILAERAARIAVLDQNVKSLTADKSDLLDRLTATEARLMAAEARIDMLEFQLAERPATPRRVVRLVGADYRSRATTPQTAPEPAPQLIIPPGVLRERGIIGVALPEPVKLRRVGRSKA